VSAPAQAADYVGLGDSYSSGTGTAGSYDDNCQRTGAAYPEIIRPQLPGAATGVNLSCSGARTQHITTEAQAEGNTAPQLDLPGIGSDTEWVTLQIGGNDAGFVDTLVACGNPFGDCDQAIDDAEETAETELPPKLDATYAAVRAEAPNAIIAVVGYPRIFRPNQSCNTFFSADEVNGLNAAADKLDQLTRQIAHENDLAYVDARPAFSGHGACDSVEWINGLSATFTNSYHPKVDGHSNGYAPVARDGLLNVPETTIQGSPGSPSNNPNPQFQFTSDVPGSTFQCKLDGGAFTSCSSPRQYTGVGQGSHTFQVRAINPNGDVDQFPASYAWTIDTTAPGISLDPTGPAGTVGSDAAEFSFASGDPSAALACRLDAGAFTACLSPHAYFDLDDGGHTFTARATDPAGNVSTASRSWTVDTTDPVATINSGPEDPTPSGEAHFGFNVDEAGAQAQCRLDPPGLDPGDETAPWMPCDSATSQTYTGLPEADHLFQVRGLDAVGNAGPADSFAWTVDSTAATVTIDPDPPGTNLDPPLPLTNQPSAAFAFTADDPSATLTCELDGEGFEPCTSGQAYDDLEEGPHSFTVKATDTASNVATDSWSWTIDLTEPAISLDSGPEGTVTSGSAEFGFSSTDPTATFQCKLDDELEAAFEPCASPHSETGLDDGEHDFDVRAIDPAGNESSVEGVRRTWSVDRSSPGATITEGPATLSADSAPTFEFTTDEPGADFQCRIDSSVAVEFEPCETPRTYEALDDGPHSFDVRAVDAAGNVGPIDSHTWSIDTLAPLASVDQHPPELSSTNAASFSFHADQPGSGFECRLDSPNEGDFHSCSSPRSYSNLPGGSHHFEVRAKDAAGNVGPVAVFDWTSDTVNPSVSIQSGPSGLTNQATASFGFTVSEPAAMTCSLDGAAFVACTSGVTAEYPSLADGPHTLTVKATDAVGRTGTDSRSWTVDATPPAVEISSGPEELTNETVAAFGFTFDPGTTVECKLDGGAFSPCVSPKSYSVLDGPHTVTVRATDAATNSASDTWSWTVDAIPPVATIVAGPPASTTATTADFEFNANEAGTLQCSLDGAIFAACTPPVSHSGLALGDHSFRVRAVDAAGNVGPPDSRAWRVVVPPAQGVAGTTTKPAKKCAKKKRKRKPRKKCRARRAVSRG
jgi:hypothetical protein